LNFRKKSCISVIIIHTSFSDNTGLTGGLAAPFVAAGAGAIIGGAGAAALGSTAGVAIIGSLFGVAGAGLTGNTAVMLYNVGVDGKTYV